MNSLAGYRSSADRERAVDELARAAGAEVHVIGTSVEGRPIRAARVPSRRRPAAKSVLVCAGIHGPEYIGVEVALGFLERLPSPALDDLLDRAEIWVLPSLNPDGYERTWARGGIGTLNELRANAHGVDLNRNYPLPRPQKRVWLSFGGWRTGSDDPANPFFRGTSPGSEPETAALIKLAADVHFDASVSLHSAMGLLIPPHVTNASSVASYRALCTAFADAQPHTRYRPNFAGHFDLFAGEQEDHQHHVHGTWSIAVEHYPLWVDVRRFLQPDVFRRSNPPAPRAWVDNDVPGIAAYVRTALALPPPEPDREP
jgi:hypothetical protein